jgi:hypothetical protein
VPIYTNPSITEEGRQCMQNMYLYIPIIQLHRRQDSVYRRGTYIYKSINYTEEVRQCIQRRYLYIPIIQLHRRRKASYTEEVPIFTNQSITQRR